MWPIGSFLSRDEWEDHIEDLEDEDDADAQEADDAWSEREE